VFGFSPMALLAAAVAAAAIALSSFGAGWHERGLRADLVISEMKQKGLEALGEARLIAQRDTKVLNDKIAELDGKAQLERENAKKATDLYHAALRAGSVRVSVPIAAGSSCAPAGDGALAGDAPQARAELDPKAAADLDAIAAEGDQAIRDLNEVIDLYNAARAALNRE
jgi:hypothetical protein